MAYSYITITWKPTNQNIWLEVIDNVGLLDTGLCRSQTVGRLPRRPALDASRFEPARLRDALPAERMAAGKANRVAEHAGADRTAQRVGAGLTGQVE